MSKPRPRPPRTKGSTERITTGCGHLYITTNEDEQGLCEVFMTMGKAGGCAASQLETIGRLISLLLRAGIDAALIQKHLRGIRCPSPAFGNGGQVLSCADAIGIALEHYSPSAAPHIEIAPTEPVKVSKHTDKSVTQMGACPDCGGAVEHDSGCCLCRSCGWSKC